MIAEMMSLLAVAWAVVMAAGVLSVYWILLIVSGTAKRLLAEAERQTKLLHYLTQMENLKEERRGALFPARES